MSIDLRNLAGAVAMGVLPLAPSVHADWINLTGAETSPNIAEIYVRDTHVEVLLEVYVGDLETFDELIPDGWLQAADVQRAPLAERLARFAEERFQLVTDTGERLPVQLRLVEPRLRKDRKSPFAGMINPITRQRVPEAPEDKRVMYAELLYQFAKKPAALTIVPPLDSKGVPEVSIGFIAYHKAVPVIDFRYLGAPAQLTLDWDDPWYSKFDNRNLKRHHQSALMSYLYVEPYEVRHEVLTRVKDLEQWMELGLRGERYMEPDELQPLKQRIGEFLLTRNPVVVDGTAVKPILDRTSFVKLSLNGIQIIDQPERLEVSTAVVGVILAYITDGIPQSVNVDWDLFTDQVQRVPATAVDPAGPFQTYLTREDNVHEWTNFLKNYRMPVVEEIAVSATLSDLELPVGTLLCLGVLLPVGWQIRTRLRHQQSMRFPVAIATIVVTAGLLLSPFFRVSVAKPVTLVPTVSDGEARLIAEHLLKNVYRAFDFREEGDVYDKLALTVHGDLLADIYLQHRKSFAVQKAGGAQAKVKEVEVLNVSAGRSANRPDAFEIKSAWTAMGTVGHWGHVHARKNLYQAVITVQAVDGNWKIAGLEVLEEERVDPYAKPTEGSAMPSTAG